MVEHYGGELGVLPYPQHGKPGAVVLREPRGALFQGSSDVEFPAEFQVGRYHSLYSLKAKHPKELRVTAETEDGIIMAVQHVSLPLAAVQFHPESILTRTDLGLQMLRNALSQLRY